MPSSFRGRSGRLYSPSSVTPKFLDWCRQYGTRQRRVMAFQRILARTGAAMLGVSSALMLAALPASAAPSSPLTGTITGDDEYTGSVNLVQQGEQPTSLMGLWVNGTVDYMYCVELTV